MPPQVWRLVSAVLAEQLDPANGGDARLYRQLEQTLEADREQPRAAW
jgi:hypothetical protein